MTNELRERYDDARGQWSDWRQRALEDLKFSNPAKPEQWDPLVVSQRGSERPALVFDQTNQYIGQVVNDARQNKAAIEVLPGDSKASSEAAEVYGGLIRQIEYASRAQIAYDTAIEYAARIGMGFILVVPELVDPALNDHDIRIKSVHDPLAVTFDPESVEPDGQDADCAWLETRMSQDAFKRRWKKAKPLKFSGDRFYDGKSVTVCQYFERGYEKANRIVTQDGEEFGEDEYHAQSQKLGRALPVHTTYLASKPKVKWSWWNGEEILEETDYPAPFIGIVPVYGNVLWIDGKREICGMTRRMRDGQCAYNYERSTYIERVALSPKAPYIGPAEAVGPYQEIWDNLNRENRAILPYRSRDANGQPIDRPQRQEPPLTDPAAMQNAQLALSDIEASLGMHKASLGQNSNAKSGVAITRLQREGDTATFHYIDNLSRSVEQVGRVCVAMIPTYYDRARVARMLQVDGKPQAVQINPSLPAAHDASGDILAVNPAIGAYDVRVKTGPSYTSMRQEMADKLVQIGQSNPPLAAALSPLVLQMADMPGADKAIRVALALLPPEVRAAYEDKSNQPEIPPQIQQAMQQADQQMQAMQAQIEEMGNALQQAAREADELKASKDLEFKKLLIDAFGKETDRLKVVGTAMGPEQIQALVMQTLQQVLTSPDPTPMPGGMPMEGGMQGMHDQMPEQGMPIPMQGGPMPPDGMGGPPPQMMNPNEPPPGGFSLPDQGPMPPEGMPQGMPPGIGPQQ